MPKINDIPRRDRRWRCADCRGGNIQVRWPGWFREGRDYSDVLLDVDSEADRSFYCEDCGEEPSEVIDRIETMRPRVAAPEQSEQEAEQAPV